MPETGEIEKFVSKEKGVTHLNKLINNFRPGNEEKLLEKIEESSKLALTELELPKRPEKPPTTTKKFLKTTEKPRKTTEKIVSDKELQEIVEMGKSKVLTSDKAGLSSQAETLLNAAEQIEKKGKVNLIKDKNVLDELEEKGLLEKNEKGYFLPTEKFESSVEALKKTLEETGREEMI